MQVLAVQLDTVWEDKPANHQKVRDLLSRETIEPGAMIILPEMFDTGFSMNVRATAQSSTRESESLLRDLAVRYKSAVLGGVVGPIENQRASNLAVGFGPDGQLLVRYQKMQPFTPLGEDRYYGAGDKHCVFSWNGFKVAPFVCYDLRFPEIFRDAVRDGAELLVVIACWPATRTEHWLRLLQARAIENQAFAIGVNRCGTDPELSYDGRSVAFSPTGELLFQARNGEQVIVADIQPESVHQWRETFPALSDMRPSSMSSVNVHGRNFEQS